ncbi:UNVERIFIED_CONTAM: hypothetical protein RMT77_004785 [Armadillidium vulgare]
MNIKECSISNLFNLVNNVELYVRDAFGYYGHSVLLEHNGRVLTTKDGSEIFSVLEMSHPIEKLIAQSSLSIANELGDGSKLLPILCKNLLSNLMKLFSTSNEDMKKRLMINFLSGVVKDILPNLTPISLFTEIPHFELNSGNRTFLFRSIFAFLSTKFPKNLSEILSELFTNFLCEISIKNQLEDTIKMIYLNPDLYFVEIPDMVVSQSIIIDGFIITRNFNYLKNVESLKNCKFILWSCQLDFSSEDSTERFQIDESDDVTGIYFSEMILLQNTMSILTQKNINLILSSVYFPRWAVSVCQNHGISVVDMINEVEFKYLSKIFKLSDFSSQLDVKNFSDIGCENFQKFCSGNLKFVKVSSNTKQIVICGPTLSHCRQYSKACRKVIIYLYNWIQNSGNHSQFNQGSENINNSYPKLFYIPCGSFIFMKAYLYLQFNLQEDRNLQDQKRLLISTLSDILFTYQKQNPLYSSKRFIKYLQEGESYLQEMLQEVLQDESKPIESPFPFFKVLEEAILVLIQILRIEHIMKTKFAVKDINQRNFEK